MANSVGTKILPISKENETMWKSQHRGIAAAVAATTLILGGFRATEAARDAHRGTPEGSLDQLSREFRDVAKQVEPCVVRIELQATPSNVPFHQSPRREVPPGSPEDFFRRFFGEPFSAPFGAPEPTPYSEYDVPRAVGAGSGWIYDRKGHVITNDHVVRNAESLTVKLFDGREYPAEVVATDAATDIAVLQVDADDLTPGVLSDRPLEQGDIVFAFGSPFAFEFSMSQGIVSGKGRHTGILGASGYEDFIQTDAAINPGNSGGPLTNARGEIVGMNSSILTGTGFFGGIGFAIPTPMIRPVVQQLIEYKAVRRGQLGVYIQDDPKVMSSFGYRGTGAVVSDVLPGGPAEKADIQRGDIIAKLDGKSVENADDLRQTIASMRPNTRVDLTVFRAGNYRDVEVELGELTSQPREAGAEPDSVGAVPPTQGDLYEPLRMLGIEGATTLSSELAQRMGQDVSSGVVINRVRPNSAASAAGIEPGLVVTHVMDAPVSSVEELARELAARDLKEGVRLTVHVGGRDRYFFVQLPSVPLRN